MTVRDGQLTLRLQDLGGMAMACRREAAHDAGALGMVRRIAGNRSAFAAARLHLADHAARRVEEARALLEREIASEPTAPRFHLLAVIHRAAGRAQDARAALAKALYLDPDHVDALLLAALAAPDAGRLDLLFRTAFQRPPTAQDREFAHAFLDRYRRAPAPAADRAAWAALARILLASNEFLFVE